MKVKPEIEVFDMGHMRQALDLIDQGLFEEPPFVQFCMGVRWGIEGTLENLLMMKNLLPPGIPWSVLGVGKTQLPMITMGILLGGHVRVGFEDNIYLRRGSSAQKQRRDGRGRRKSDTAAPARGRDARRRAGDIRYSIVVGWALPTIALRRSAISIETGRLSVYALQQSAM